MSEISLSFSKNMAEAFLILEFGQNKMHFIDGSSALEPEI
jgi:hypothetical protein